MNTKQDCATARNTTHQSRNVDNETRESWHGALERLKNQIAWIEYVPEQELTESESARMSKACEHLIIVISKLNRKYMN